VKQRLEKAIPVSFQDEPLDAILTHLQAVTGANFIMSQAARDADVPPITLEDKASQPVSRILTIITEDLSLPPLTWTIQDGVVRVQTKEETRNDYRLEMYDIRDLTFTPKDYPAQDFNLLPSGTDKESYQAPAEEEPVPFIGADALLTLIQDNIAPDSWSSDPNRTIQLMPGTLVVRQTPTCTSRSTSCWTTCASTPSRWCTSRRASSRSRTASSRTSASTCAASTARRPAASRWRTSASRARAASARRRPPPASARATTPASSTPATTAT
jgi:hypothetical protein